MCRATWRLAWSVWPLSWSAPSALSASIRCDVLLFRCWCHADTLSGTLWHDGPIMFRCQDVKATSGRFSAISCNNRSLTKPSAQWWQLSVSCKWSDVISLHTCDTKCMEQHTPKFSKETIWGASFLVCLSLWLTVKLCFSLGLSIGTNISPHEVCPSCNKDNQLILFDVPHQLGGSWAEMLVVPKDLYLESRETGRSEKVVGQLTGR